MLFADRPIIVDPVTSATASPTTTSQFPHSGDDISSTESRTTNTGKNVVDFDVLVLVRIAFA